MDYRLKKLYESMVGRNNHSLARNASLASIYESMSDSVPSLSSSPLQTAVPSTTSVNPNTQSATVNSPSGSAMPKGTSEEYNKLIADLAEGGVYPTPKGNYALGTPFQVDKLDQEFFAKLFSLAAKRKDDEETSSGSGKGEIALYWLFSKNHTVNDERKSDLPDLKVDGVGVEVKNYPKGQGFNLGKFKKQTHNRSILAYLLGIYSLFKDSDDTLTVDANSNKTVDRSLEDVMDTRLETPSDKSLDEALESKKGPRAVTVDVFNGEEIQKAATKLLEIQSGLNTILATIENNESLKTLFDQLPFLKKLQSSINRLEKMLYSEEKLVDKSAEQIGADIIRKLLLEKLGTKPGKGGYYVNIRSSAGPIEWYKVNLEKIKKLEAQDIIDNVSSASGELRIKYPSVVFDRVEFPKEEKTPS